ncbi:MAG: hypothetical protein AAFM91_13985 [Pseudomonadota bacterium]
MADSKQYLKLAELSFSIESAQLTAGLPDPYWCDTYNQGDGKKLRWRLKVCAEGMDVDDTFWPPSILINDFPLRGRNWRDLEDREYALGGPDNERSAEFSGSVFVFQHGSIRNARLKFVGRDSTVFSIRCAGLCDIYFDEQYDRNIAFCLAAAPRFSGITVAGCERDTLATLRSRLDQYLNVSDFNQGEIQIGRRPYDSGVGTVSCRFTPKG